MGGVIFLWALSGLGFEMAVHSSVPGFTVTLRPNPFINFSVSVENLNIRGQEFSQEDFNIQSGKSVTCDIQHVRAFILYSSKGQAIRSVPLQGMCSVP